MSVEISPSAQLGFPRPLTQVVKRSIYVSNSNSQPVAFKVKTTAPKQYCVRPNSGRVDPGERVEVQVLMQPLKEEPPLSAKCRDKFLIQSAIISADKETLPIADFWAAQEGQKDLISEHKIRCVYLPASSEPLPEENEDVSAVGAGALGAGAVGAGALGAGAVGSGALDSGALSSSASYVPSAPANNHVQPPISIASLSNVPSGQVATAPYSAKGDYATNSLPLAGVASSSSVAPAGAALSNRALSPQELEAENARLRAQLASNGTGFRTATQKASTGVPVHIVAAIAVAVFAVTYLFF
ncbi:phosphatidylinositol-binding protein scs2 [Malassezia nana]|uniref:Phosphatidylinositol-binding protein scs2 n=1 Tax=Malassezia nana TaxID=180528 RepID=A0AAF0EQ10_9BASI|nr:phosphatidylinositol-binding protein scs2 [Malassezia nana]